MIIESKQLPDREGYQLRAYLEPDIDSTPDDADCYSDADKVAWWRDMWSYVTVVVEASRHGVTLSSAALSAVEYGNLTGVKCDPLNDDPAGLDALAREAIDESNRLIDALTEDNT